MNRERQDKIADAIITIAAEDPDVVAEAIRESFAEDKVERVISEAVMSLLSVKRYGSPVGMIVEALATTDREDRPRARVSFTDPLTHTERTLRTDVNDYRHRMLAFLVLVLAQELNLTRRERFAAMRKLGRQLCETCDGEIPSGPMIGPFVQCYECISRRIKMPGARRGHP